MSMFENLSNQFQELKTNAGSNFIKDNADGRVNPVSQTASKPGEAHSEPFSPTTHNAAPGTQPFAPNNPAYGNGAPLIGNQNQIGTQPQNSTKKRSSCLVGIIALVGLILLLVIGVKACNSVLLNKESTATPVDRVDLHVNIGYESNIVFAKYDIEVRIDGTKIGVISQGGTLENTVPLIRGNHTIKFFKDGSSSSYAESKITIEEESYYECSLKSHTLEIDINNERFETATDHEKRLAEEQAARDREEAEKQAAEEEKERQRQAEEEERSRLIEDLNACVGQNATQAKETAEGLDCKAVFKDSSGEDVTELFAAVSDESAIHKATVVDSEFNESYGKKTATFKLDYTLPNNDSLKGKPLVETCKRLEEEGIDFTIIGKHTGQDLTSIYELGDYDDSDMVIASAEWISKKDASMKIYTISQSQLDEEIAKNQTEMKLRDVLHPNTAWLAVQSYGEGVYGSSFKAHYYSGLLAQEPIDDDTWFLKALCDVNGRSCNVEAKVTGTNDNPVVIDFAVY